MCNRIKTFYRMSRNAFVTRKLFVLFFHQILAMCSILLLIVHVGLSSALLSSFFHKNVPGYQCVGLESCSMPRKGCLVSFSSSFNTADALWDKYVDISAEKDGSIMKRLLKRGDAKLGYPLKRDRVRVSWELETEEGMFIHHSADYEDSEGDYYDFLVGMQPCEVLKGMDLAAQSMFQGEVASFLLTSSLGFGAEGFEDIVPPNTSLRLLLSLRRIEYSLERTYGRGDPSETAEERLQKQLAEGKMSLDPKIFAEKPDVPHGNSVGFQGDGAPVQGTRVFFDSTKHTVDPRLSVEGIGQNGLRWEENKEQMEIRLKLPPYVQSKEQVQITLQPRYLSVSALNAADNSAERVLEGPLAGKVYVSQCVWAVQKEEQEGVVELVMCLEKAHDSKDFWTTVIDRAFLPAVAMEETEEQAEGVEGGEWELQ